MINASAQFISHLHEICGVNSRSLRAALFGGASIFVLIEIELQLTFCRGTISRLKLNASVA